MYAPTRFLLVWLCVAQTTHPTPHHTHIHTPRTHTHAARTLVPTPLASDIAHDLDESRLLTLLRVALQDVDRLHELAIADRVAPAQTEKTQQELEGHLSALGVLEEEDLGAVRFLERLHRCQSYHMSCIPSSHRLHTLRYTKGEANTVPHSIDRKRTRVPIWRIRSSKIRRAA